MKLLALTACCVDYYPQNDLTLCGGNSLNVAAMWKNLDPESLVSVISCLGSDYHGSLIMEFFESAGIDKSHVVIKEGPTTYNQLRVDSEGERFGIEDTWLGGVNEDFLLSWKDWELVKNQDMISIPANNPNFKEMLARKHDKQLLLVDYLDVENGIDPAGTISRTDIACIAGRPAHIPALRELAFSRDKLLLLTMGAEGSVAFYKGQEYRQAAIAVEQVTDTTGCGDAFQATFALNFMKTKRVQSAMKSAAEASSRVVKMWGGTAGLMKEGKTNE